TGDALEAGRLDMAKARVICEVTEHLPPETAGRVESAALEKAPEQTTGQLRRRIKRIAQRLAPEAIEERKREALRQRRLEVWDTPSGTSDLALCDLAPEDAHAIHNKITAAARGIKADGDTRPLNAIRADLATQLLHGAQLPDAVRTLLTQTRDNPDTDPVRPVGGGTADTISMPQSPRTGATINVASPKPAKPGKAASADHLHGDLPGGHGDLPGDPGAADTGIAALADEVDQRLNHVRGRVDPRDLPHAIRQTARNIHGQLAQARATACQGDDDIHGRLVYRPPAAMRREIEARHATCVFPTCNQPSHRCDLDHTVPWQPGVTCHCNLAPLCRRHHRLKQRTDWRLFQIWAGLLIWITPSGAWYIVRPDRQ
ncbi:HNH endonuclease signature motif containing protein, partial [Actinomadura chokoriensis]